MLLLSVKKTGEDLPSIGSNLIRIVIIFLKYNFKSEHIIANYRFCFSLALNANY